MKDLGPRTVLTFVAVVVLGIGLASVPDGQVADAASTEPTPAVPAPDDSPPIDPAPGDSPTPPASALPAPPTCGGQTINKPDGSAWQCTFADEFDGSDLDRSVWSVQKTATSGYQIGNDCYVDTPSNVDVAGGALKLTAREETDEFSCDSPGGDYPTSWTAGMVTTVGSFAQTFGRYEIRASFPDVTVPGVHGALWLWPVDATRYGYWPASGEIDIAEFYSQYPDRAIPFLHYPSAWYDFSVTNNYCIMDDPSKPHTYVLEWTTTKLKVTFDGQTCVDHTISPTAPLTAPMPFDHPYFMALTQGLGLGGNARTDATPFPATTTIDYVRVWK